jgi:type II secretory pathway component PulJ
MVTGEGFSLVEVVVAVGLFAFVIVGILAMFPIGLRQHARSANDFAAVQAAGKVMTLIGAATNRMDVSNFLSANTTTNVIGVSVKDPSVWQALDAGVWSGGTLQTGVDALVRVLAEPIGGVLHRVTFDVSYPAAAAITNRQVESFTTLVHKP